MTKRDIALQLMRISGYHDDQRGRVRPPSCESTTNPLQIGSESLRFHAPMSSALAEQLALKAKELTSGMLSRVSRLPDKADYEVSFRRIIEQHCVKTHTT